MAKININFNDKKYSIDESFLSASTDSLKSHLSTVMNGTGATINLGGASYNVDSTKLTTATNAFVTYLGTIAGSDYKVVVNGVEYGVDYAKMTGAINELHTVFNGLQNGGEEAEDELAGTWILNDVLNKPDATVSFKASGRMTTYGTSTIVAEFTGGYLYNLTGTPNIFELDTMSKEYPRYENIYRNNGNVHIRYYKNGSTPTSSKTIAYSGTDYAKLEITSSLAESENGEALLTWLQANARKL